MPGSRRSGAAVLAALLLVSTGALGEETRVVVRALAQDGKFIGTSMGGALVVLRDAATGEVLARGETQGSTGDTKRLMKEPRVRGQALATPGAARFEARLELEEPRLVTVEVTAPRAQRQAQVTSSTQVWLVPGKHLEGDGVVLTVPGFAVDVLEPGAHQFLKLTGPRLKVPLRAHVVLMCGCPTEPGGLWDSSRYEIRALLKHEGRSRGSVALEYAGQPDTYQAELTVDQKGPWEVTVYAYDPVTGNTGVDRTTFVVE